MICSSMGAFHGLQSFTNVLLQRGSPIGHMSCKKTCFCVDSSQWVTARTRSLLQHGLFTGCSFYQGTSTCSTVDLHGLQEDNLRHRGLHHGLQGNLCSGTEAPPSPPSLLTLMSAELFLSHILTPLFQMLFHSSFFPFLNMLSQRHYHCC